MTKENETKSEGSSCGCGGGGSCHCKGGRWTWVILGVVILGGLILAKEISGRKQAAPVAPAAVEAGAQAGAAVSVPLPRLVDLGAGTCIPCKMMAPILEDLKKTYAGKMEVQFIDVWENPDAGKQYGISVIPTQIFYDAAGKELFRHEGFFGRDDILAKWKEFGVEL
jgi:thioredoxin 1